MHLEIWQLSMIPSNHSEIPNSYLFIIILPFSVTVPLLLVDISAGGDLVYYSG